MNRLSVVSLALLVAIATLGCAVSSEAGKAAPAISSVSPASAVAGGPSFTLTVSGSNFSPSSVVLFNGMARTTTFISKTLLAASIVDSDVARVGTAQVVVANSKPFPQQSNSFPLIIQPSATPLQIATNSLPSAIVQLPYNANVAINGGIGPYTWKLASGQLPSGLALSAWNGVISGAPAQAGKFNFTTEVTDSSPLPQTASQALALSVAPSPNPLLINTTTLPNGTVQVAYSATLAASGGGAPYTWSTVSGLLPPGLALTASTGSIAGAPTQAGGYSFTVQVRDSSPSPQSATQALSLTIAGPALQIATGSLPGGAVGVSYNTTLAPANGVPPYTWSISGGQFPPGLALQASTGQISGTPTQSGAFSFLVQVKDSTGQTASGGLSINIAPATAPIVSSVSPNAGPTTGGTAVTIAGANFQAGATVLFGGVAASSVTVSSATQIHAVTPVHAAGTVDVTVRNPDAQSSTLSSSFVYNVVSPSVASVSPNSGPAAGGTSVTITGTNFLAGALVLFGTAPASGVTVSSATQIQAVSPANTAGAVDVTVQNPDSQSGKLASGFTYTAPAPVGTPTISGVSPNSGPAGTQVTINGTNFGSGAVVAFGSTNAASTVFVSSTQLTASVPSIGTGVVDAKVTNPGGASATLPGGFTVTTPQSLLSGCVVNSNNTPSCAIPSGWTLVATQGFEGSTPSTESWNGQVSSSTSHSGSRSLFQTIAGDGAADQWRYLEGNFKSRELYLSYYDKGTGVLFNEEYVPFHLIKHGLGPPFDFIELGFALSYLGTPGPSGGFQFNTPDGFLQGAVQGNRSFPFYGSTAAPGYGSTGWNQWEIWHKANTPGSSDGFLRVYLNGVRVWDIENFNWYGTTDMTGMQVEAGGWYTKSIWTIGGPLPTGTCASSAGAVGASETSTCTNFNSCACPPNPPIFNRYIDDVILLEK